MWLAPSESSPGYGWHRLANENQKLLEQHYDKVLDIVVARCKLLSSHDFRSLTARELVYYGLADPARYFVKNEPHPVAKIETRRFRLINSVSLPDVTLERVFSGIQNNTEIAQWSDIPSKPGFGFSDEASRRLYETVPTHIVETDVSGWDWTVQGWELQAEAQMRIRLIRSPSAETQRLILNRFHIVANKVCAFSDAGFVEVSGGVMPSGCYNTSSSNSRIRVLAATLVGSGWVCAMGDDCLETNARSLEEMREGYQRLGHVVKDIRRSSKNSFEFCSQHYADGAPTPVTLVKTLRKLVSGAMTEQQVGQFAAYCRNHSDVDKALDLVKRIGSPQKNGHQTTVSERTEAQELDCGTERDEVEATPRLSAV